MHIAGLLWDLVRSWILIKTMHLRDASSGYNLEGGLGKKCQGVMEEQSRVKDGIWLAGRGDGW